MPLSRTPDQFDTLIPRGHAGRASPETEGITMDKMRHTESVMKDMLRLRKALDRLDTRIRKQPELMASDYMNELAYEVSGAAASVTEAVHDRTGHHNY
ncbi:MAG: hypothetical protein GY904_10845 [Planctomycetaceae bacterium]|nr:hypothetical protein [Planctomycetaceae bacterium]